MACHYLGELIIFQAIRPITYLMEDKTPSPTGASMLTPLSLGGFIQTLLEKKHADV
jgi:hypothetical protein